MFGLLRDAWRAVLRPYAGPAELLATIAMGSLPLAATGVIGFLMFSVRTRSREIAIRLALGADPDVIRRAVVRRALFIVGSGLILGAVVGIAAGRVVASQLFMVHPADWWTMAAMAALLLTVAWLAAVVPARRAARTEPAIALRDHRRHVDRRSCKALHAAATACARTTALADLRRPISRSPSRRAPSAGALPAPRRQNISWDSNGHRGTL